MTVSPATTNPLTRAASEAQHKNQTRLAELRHAAEQLVGITFFQTLLQSAHNSTLKGEFATSMARWRFRPRFSRSRD